MFLALSIGLWLFATNVIAFGAFGHDKHLAREGAWRISEQTLLLLALVGGSIGAIAGQRYFRHKTRKEPFRTVLHAIPVLQIIAVTALVVWPDLIPRPLARLAF